MAFPHSEDKKRVHTPTVARVSGNVAHSGAGSHGFMKEQDAKPAHGTERPHNATEKPETGKSWDVQNPAYANTRLPLRAHSPGMKEKEAAEGKFTPEESLNFSNGGKIHAPSSIDGKVSDAPFRAPGFGASEGLVKRPAFMSSAGGVNQ
jgi:hypothetical protein